VCCVCVCMLCVCVLSWFGLEGVCICKQAPAWHLHADPTSSTQTQSSLIQHTHRSVTVVDGRAGEDWLVYSSTTPPSPPSSSSPSPSPSPSSSSAAAAATSHPPPPTLHPMYDAASSWWTQTCRADLQTEVARAVAAAAGRYMHLLWPEVAHEPGLVLTKRLLEGPLGSGWASRVFFSDDGSTAIEVALKMAFRRFQVDWGLLEVEEGGAPRLEVRAVWGGVGFGWLLGFGVGWGWQCCFFVFEMFQKVWRRGPHHRHQAPTTPATLKPPSLKHPQIPQGPRTPQRLPRRHPGGDGLRGSQRLQRAAADALVQVRGAD